MRALGQLHLLPPAKWRHGEGPLLEGGTVMLDFLFSRTGEKILSSIIAQSMGFCHSNTMDKDVPLLWVVNEGLYQRFQFHHPGFRLYTHIVEIASPRWIILLCQNPYR